MLPYRLPSGLARLGFPDSSGRAPGAAGGSASGTALTGAAPGVSAAPGDADWAAPELRHRPLGPARRPRPAHSPGGRSPRPWGSGCRAPRAPPRGLARHCRHPARARRQPRGERGVARAFPSACRPTWAPQPPAGSGGRGSSPTRGLKARALVVNTWERHGACRAGGRGSGRGGEAAGQARGRLPPSALPSRTQAARGGTARAPSCASAHPAAATGLGGFVPFLPLPSWRARRPVLGHPPPGRAPRVRGRGRSGGSEVHAEAAVGAQEAGVGRRRAARGSLDSLTRRHPAQTGEAPLLVGKELQQGACPPA